MDIWRSIDQGVTWTEDEGYGGVLGIRSSHTCVVLPDDSIVLMGGGTGGYTVTLYNDVYRSTDKGLTWTKLTEHAEWPGRIRHTSVVLPDGSIILMGGLGDGWKPLNDVWRSVDNGVTWTQQPTPPWEARDGHSSDVLPDGSIVLMGGNNGTHPLNDVWRSADQGATWTLQTPWAAWYPRSHHGSVVVPDGSIILMGGESNCDDVRRSTDMGVTWTLQTASAPWIERAYHASVVLPDGSVVLIGGLSWGGGHLSLLNDVWRLETASSSAQHPQHVYTTPGTTPSHSKPTIPLVI